MGFSGPEKLQMNSGSVKTKKPKQRRLTLSCIPILLCPDACDLVTEFTSSHKNLQQEGFMQADKFL